MPLSNRDPFDDNCAHLKTFPDHILLDIARNGAAQHDYRLFAVELLHSRKSPKLQHPDIQGLVRDLEIELEGIVFEHPAPSPGPLVASVTTSTMFADNRVENGFTGFDFEDPSPNEQTEKANVSPTKPAPIPTKPENIQKPKEPVDAP